jgi:hypothetical protein
MICQRVSSLFAAAVIQTLCLHPCRALQIEDATTRPITVGVNVLVSKSRTDQPHWEVQIASDPNDPNNLLACSIAGYGEQGEQRASTVVHASFDGGKTWRETLNIRSSGVAIDPSCAYGLNGLAYVVALTYDDGGMPFFKSTDSGRTWAAVQLPARGDREYITIDNTASRYRGQIYLTAQGLLKQQSQSLPAFELWRLSRDGEILLGPAKLTAPDSDQRIGATGNGVTLSDGKFVAITSELDKKKVISKSNPYELHGRIIAVSSNDGGQSFLPIASVGDWYHDGAKNVTSGLIPVLAADGSSGPFKDRLYAVWSDMRSGRMAVIMSHSSDKGRTWSAPIAVSEYAPPADVSDRPDDGLPSVAVNSTGVVGVMWYDRRDSPDNLGYWPRFSASRDGGESFLPSVKLSDAASSFEMPNLLLGASDYQDVYRAKGNFRVGLGISLRQFSGGDTSGLTASSDGVFHALWVDNRTGIPQVWTAPATVAGKRVESNPEQETTLINGTDSVIPSLGRAVYYRATRTVILDVSLENASTIPLQGPLRLQLEGLSSMLGGISVTNSDNNVNGIGAAWDFARELDNGVLASRTRTRSRRLEFQLTEKPEAARTPQAWQNMIHVQAKVLAPAPSQAVARKQAGVQ